MESDNLTLVTSEDNELSALDILNLDDSELQPIEIPEWKKNGKPGKAYISVLSADEMIRFNELLSNPAQKKEALMRLVAYGLRNKNGERLITDDKIHEFKKRSIKVFIRLQNEIMELNGLSDKAKNAEDELRKNA
jgi:hypothetical protein